MEAPKNLYDLCIVGAGPFGSAAARHATLLVPGLKVCLIGPKEPKDYQERKASNHGIFSSHYDEGRIFTSLLTDPIWIELARRSLKNFEDIELKTGIKFFSNVGHLLIISQDDPMMQTYQHAADITAIKNKPWNKDILLQKYPFLTNAFSEDTVVIQGEFGGHLSPRKLIKAQQSLAFSQGCDIINDVVDQVTELTQADGSKYMKLTCADGNTYFARKVLLAPGGFIGFRDLLPRGMVLDLKLKEQSLAFVELGKEDARRLEEMPTISWKTDIGKIHYYVLPPIKYSDGKHYLKIGWRTDKELFTAREVAEYFQRNPNEMCADSDLLEVLLKLINDIKVVSTRGDSCVSTHTGTGVLYCDMITPTLGVTTGGNGCGVQSSDEIGRMAARMIISGGWDHDLPREKFRAKFKAKRITPAQL